jgi:hypothetical protein
MTRSEAVTRCGSGCGVRVWAGGWGWGWVRVRAKLNRDWIGTSGASCALGAVSPLHCVTAGSDEVAAALGLSCGFCTRVVAGR